MVIITTEPSSCLAGSFLACQCVLFAINYIIQLLVLSQPAEPSCQSEATLSPSLGETPEEGRQREIVLLMLPDCEM